MLPPSCYGRAQYENLTSPGNERSTLRQLKAFLGIDPSLPTGPNATLGMNNLRKRLINPHGWLMKRMQYERIVQLVRPDCMEVAALVTKHGLGDGEEWMENWERVWAANLATCNAQGNCRIELT